MHDVILEFLRGENVSAVLSVTSASYRELSCVEYRYIKDGNIYMARVYFTVAWISMSPLGPTHQTTSDMGVDSLGTFEDIADIQQYLSVVELKRVPAITSSQLESFYCTLSQQAEEYARKVLAGSDCQIVMSHFSFLPHPHVMVALTSDRTYLGSVSVSVNGNIEVVSCYDSSLHPIINSLKVKGLNPAKELDCYGD